MNSNFKTFIYILFTFSICYVHGQKKITNPFDTLKYNKVVAFDFNGGGGREIVTDDHINTLLVVKQITLTSVQVKKVNQIVGSKKTYGSATAACFDPHIGLVYYQNNKIVGHINICLDCNYLISSTEIPATLSKKWVLEDNSNYYLFGFSKNGRKLLNNFCKELNFTHCVDKLDGPFDQ